MLSKKESRKVDSSFDNILLYAISSDQRLLPRCRPCSGTQTNLKSPSRYNLPHGHSQRNFLHHLFSKRRIIAYSIQCFVTDFNCNRHCSCRPAFHINFFLAMILIFSGRSSSLPSHHLLQSPAMYLHQSKVFVFCCMCRSVRNLRGCKKV